MGKIDFSIIDGRYKKPKFKKKFGGKIANCAKRTAFLDKNNIQYTTRRAGNVMVLIDANLNEITYMDKPEYLKSNGKDVLSACKKVAECVDSFTEKHGPIEYGNAATQFSNDINIYEHILNGNDTVSLVDINHCYWRLLYNYKIITEAVYNEFKTKRDARIVATGNLNKTTTAVLSDGKERSYKKVENQRDWAWHFVVYKTYKAIMAIKEKVNNNIFSYNTDGVYLPEKYTDEAVSILTSLNLPCKVLKFKIIGTDSYFTIIQNINTGEYKRANLGKIRGLKGILPVVSFENLTKNKQP